MATRTALKSARNRSNKHTEAHDWQTEKGKSTSCLSSCHGRANSRRMKPSWKRDCDLQRAAVTMWNANMWVKNRQWQRLWARSIACRHVWCYLWCHGCKSSWKQSTNVWRAFNQQQKHWWRKALVELSSFTPASPHQFVLVQKNKTKQQHRNTNQHLTQWWDQTRIKVSRWCKKKSELDEKC